MLLDRFEHVAEPPQHMGPDRLALERAGPHLAGGSPLLAEMSEMIGPGTPPAAR